MLSVIRLSMTEILAIHKIFLGDIVLEVDVGVLKHVLEIYHKESKETWQSSTEQLADSIKLKADHDKMLRLAVLFYLMTNYTMDLLVIKN